MGAATLFHTDRLTQAEVEAHPAWGGFGSQAGKHPPMRGWLATAVCGEDDRRYGLLQLSDKHGDADFTEEDSESIRDLAAWSARPLTRCALPARDRGNRRARGPLCRAFDTRCVAPLNDSGPVPT